MDKRDFSFDFIKGFLIALVVLGHTIYMVFSDDSWNNYIFHVIYSFHMPLFFFISGYFFKSCLRMTFYEMIMYRFKRLLIPTMIFTCILFIINFISFGFKIHSLWNVYELSKTYWFLICLFCLTIIYYIFVKKTSLIRILLFLLFFVSIIFYKKLPIFILVDCQVIRMLPIMGLGIFYYFNKNKIQKILGNNILHYSIILFSIFEICFVRYLYGINLMNYSIIIRIIDGIYCSIIMFEVLKKIYTYTSKHYNLITNCFVKFGSNTLGIYLVHMIFCKFVSYNNIHIYIYNNWLTISSLFILLFYTSYFITLLIKKTKLRKIFLGE